MPWNPDRESREMSSRELQDSLADRIAPGTRLRKFARKAVPFGLAGLAAVSGLRGGEMAKQFGLDARPALAQENEQESEKHLFQATVTVDGLPVYDSSREEARKINELPMGTSLFVVGGEADENGFIRYVDENDTSQTLGFLPYQGIEVGLAVIPGAPVPERVASAEQNKLYRATATAAVRVRSTPEIIDGNVVDIMESGEEVLVQGTGSQEWSQVFREDGTPWGWSASRYLSVDLDEPVDVGLDEEEPTGELANVVTSVVTQPGMGAGENEDAKPILKDESEEEEPVPTGGRYTPALSADQLRFVTQTLEVNSDAKDWAGHTIEVPRDPDPSREGIFREVGALEKTQVFIKGRVVGIFSIEGILRGEKIIPDEQEIWYAEVKVGEKTMFFALGSLDLQGWLGMSPTTPKNDEVSVATGAFNTTMEIWTS